MEDAEFDRQLIEEFAPKAKRIFAHANDTVLHLAQSLGGVKAIHICGPDVEKIKAKLFIATHYSRDNALFLLGHHEGRMDDRERARELKKMAKDSHADLEIGAIHEGLDKEDERFWREVRRRLPYTLMNSILLMNDPHEIQAYVTRSGLEQWIKDGLKEVCTDKNLVEWFGYGALMNRIWRPWEHVYRSIMPLLTNGKLKENPYVMEMLFGTGGKEFPWLQENYGTLVGRQLGLMFFPEGVDEVLEKSPPMYDVVCLSNILDSMCEMDAARVLKLVYNALVPGGIVIVRQMNSTIDLGFIASKFHWEMIEDGDRTNLYAVYVGEKDCH